MVGGAAWLQGGETSDIYLKVHGLMTRTTMRIMIMITMRMPEKIHCRKTGRRIEDNKLLRQRQRHGTRTIEHDQTTPS